MVNFLLGAGSQYLSKYAQFPKSFFLTLNTAAWVKESPNTFYINQAKLSKHYLKELKIKMFGQKFELFARRRITKFIKICFQSLFSYSKHSSMSNGVSKYINQATLSKHYLKELKIKKFGQKFDLFDKARGHKIHQNMLNSQSLFFVF